MKKKPCVSRGNVENRYSDMNLGRLGKGAKNASDNPELNEFHIDSDAKMRLEELISFARKNMLRNPPQGIDLSSFSAKTGIILQRYYSGILNSIFERIHLGVVFVEKGGFIVECNNSFAEMLGYSRKELSGVHLSKISRAQDTQDQELAAKLVKGELPCYAIERSYVRKDKIQIMCRLTVCGIRDEKTDEFVIAIGLVENISVQRKLADELKKSEALFKLIANNSPIGIYLTDPDGKCIYANPRWLEMAGMTFAEAQGDGWKKGIHPADREHVFAAWNDMIASRGKWGYEYRFMTKKGIVTWVYGIAVAVTDSSGEISCYLGTNTDITERKNTQLQLKEKESLLEEARTLAGIGNWEWDPKKREGVISSSFGAMLGLKGSVKRVSPSFLNHIIPEDKALARKVFAQSLKTGVFPQFECGVRNEDGSVKFLRIMGDVIFGKSFNKRRIPLKIVGTCIDVTDSKLAEEKLKKANEVMEARIVERTAEISKQAEQIKNLLDMKTRLVNQLNHDIRTPLTPVTLLLPSIRKEINDPELIKKLDVCIKNISYLDELINSTLDYSAIDSGEVRLNVKHLNLSHAVALFVEGKREELCELGQGDSLNIISHIAPNVWVRADPVRLTEILNNVMSNAAKFMKGDGTVKISVKKKKSGALISFADSGIGMDKKTINSLFDEFFKADLARHDLRGHGLGLPICKKLVELHGGKIWAESAGLNKGSVVHILLPLA